jgi:N6-L-threonylcarbamoyladenine synthase
LALILGIESTCDETAASVVRDGVHVLSNVVATQTELHAKFRGVVPEIASRAHLENISPVISEALEKAGVSFDEIDAIAVAHRPGLVGSLLIGVTAAKTLAWSLGKPLVGVDHVQAHLYSVMLDSNAAIRFPAVGLVVSGGHTALYSLKSLLDVELIGTTLDDAVGEAYDKVAVILGLDYPGGPIIDRLARDGRSDAVAFPRALLERDSLDFSFSGIKTSVLYHVRKNATEKRDVAASFQAACVDTLVEKVRRAVERIGARSVIIGGGVSANRGLRERMAGFSLPVFFPKPEYCTDNAAMSAGLADLLLKSGKTSGLDLDAITFSELQIQNQ